MSVAIGEQKLALIVGFASLLGIGYLCAMVTGIDSAVREQGSFVAVAMERQTELLRQIAGDTRDPLRASWVTVVGATITVEVGIEPDESEADWQARFDDRVLRNQIKYPPVELTR